MKKTHKILIVEDEILIAYSIKKMLETNYISDIVINYEEAKTALSDTIYDLILIDITLQSEKSGLDLAAYINSNFRIPFIFTTALTDSETLQKIKNLRPIAYLSKPIQNPNLITAVDLALINNQKKFKITIGKQVYHIDLEDFLYAEAEHIYINLIFKNEKSLLLRTSMSYLEEIFPDQYFKRINRSVSVNPIHISKTIHNVLYLEDKIFKISKNF